MDESSSQNDLLEVYLKSLEDQLENKKYFLKQAQHAIDRLQTDPDTYQRIPDEDWQDFLKKPMFFPGRSDSIGLSLASESLGSRQQTSEEWLEYMKHILSDMEEMVKYQHEANHEISILIELLERNSTISSMSLVKTATKSPEQLNRELYGKLEDFVRHYLSVDLLDAEDAGNELFGEIFQLIRRLINYDTSLRVTDFHRASRGLYRLLLRSNLISINKGSDDNCYVKLIDFTDSDLS